MIGAWIALVIEGVFCFPFHNDMAYNSVVQAAVIGVNFFVVLYSIEKNIKPVYKNVIVIGYIIRLAFLFWDLYGRSIFVLPMSGYDTESFYNWSVTLYETGINPRENAYAEFIVAWFQLFGVQRAIVQYVNVLLGLSSIIVVIRTLEKIEISESSIYRVVVLLSLLPNFAITNAVLLRESLIIFLVAVSSYCVISWMKGSRFSDLIYSIVAILLATIQHSGVIGIAAGLAIVVILYDKNEGHFRFSARGLLFSAIVITGFYFLYTRYQGVFFTKFGNIDSADDIVTQAARYQTGGSAYRVGFSIGNGFLNILINTPIRLFYFFLSPLPWNFRGLSDVIAFLFSSLVYLFIFLKTFLNSRFTENNKAYIIALLIVIICAGFVFAWGVSNAGTAIRHRDKMLPVFMLLYGIINNQPQEKKICR